MNPLVARFLEFYGGLTPRRRGTLAVILGVTLVVVVGLVYWAQRPLWTPVVADLEPAEARVLVEDLRAQGFRVQVDGDRLLVPAGDVEEARLAAYGSDLGSSLPGMSLLLERKGLGLTREQERATFQVALQGELAKTISRLSSVRRASVQLVMAEEALFPEDRVNARASVMLDIKPGHAMNHSHVMAVTNLVAASVPQLSPTDVVIADTDGNLLTRPINEDDGIAGVDRMLEYGREMERSLEAKALDQLERIVGPGRAEVQVTALIDTAHLESNAVDYNPTRTTPRSIQSAESEEEGNNGIASGVPGTGANMPELEPAIGGGSAQNNSRTNSELINYEIASSTEHRVQPAGTILGLSVSVLVDGEHTADPLTGETSYTPRAPEDMDQIESVVAAAVGLNLDRGDTLTVVNMPFMGEAEVEMGGTGAPIFSQIPVAPILRWLAVLAVLVMAYLYIIRPVMNSVAAPAGRALPEGDEAAMALLETRSPAFQSRIEQLTGMEVNEGADALGSVLRSNLPVTVRALRDWIEEG